MCRSIKTLRAPYAQGVTDEDIRAAALQYVQTVSGYRMPSPADIATFDEAVERVTAVTRDLLAGIEAPVAPALGSLPALARASQREGVTCRAGGCQPAVAAVGR
jgi:hypothetical protein